MTRSEATYPRGGARRGEARHVVVAGMGALTPCGSGVGALWGAVRNGRSAIEVLDDNVFTGLPVRIGGVVRGFDAEAVLSRALARRLMPAQQWAVAAADEAMRQVGVALPSPGSDGPAGWARLPWSPHRFSIITATGSGPVDATLQAEAAFQARGPRGVPVTFAAYGAPDAVGTVLAKRYGATGASHALCATCASGSSALGQGMRLIRHGYADAVLVVAVEDCLNPVNLSSNANLRALATGYEDNPAEACRPFDRGRRGFVMAQGAAAMLLTAAPSDGWRNSDTDGRGAGGDRAVIPALAELAGFGAAEDAYHPTSPHPEGLGAALAIEDCLADAGVTPDEVAHINAHATGTPAGDAAEIAAFDRVFHEAGRRIPISATKAVTGHLMGASGVAEAIIAVETLRSGVLPGTGNLADSEFPDWDIVAGPSRPAPVHNVLSTSFGFGGHDAALLFCAAPSGPPARGAA